MKKILLSSLAILFASSMFGQRTIDLSVESFISPTQINSNTQTGTPINILAVIKNNDATDTVKVGDTLIFQSTLRTTTNQVITGTNVLFRIANRKINPGDTQHFSLSYLWGSYLVNSVRVNLTLLVWVTNRPELPLDNGTNNFLSVEMDYINPNGFGVSIDEISTVGITVFPNPATTSINITLPKMQVNKDIIVTLTDLAGKTILTKSFASISELKLSTKSLDNGIYLMNIENGENSYSSKVTIAN